MRTLCKSDGHGQVLRLLCKALTLSVTCSNNQNLVTVFSRKDAFGCLMNRHSLCVMLVDFCREKAEHLELQGKLNHTSELEISVLNLLVVSVRC